MNVALAGFVLGGFAGVPATASWHRRTSPGVGLRGASPSPLQQQRAHPVVASTELIGHADHGHVPRRPEVVVHAVHDDRGE